MVHFCSTKKTAEELRYSPDSYAGETEQKLSKEILVKAQIKSRITKLISNLRLQTFKLIH